MPTRPNPCARVLRTDGHHVEVVYDGAAGLARLEDFRADFVLLDIGLPRMDGFMVAHAIRERFALAARRPKLLALTGYGRDDDRSARAQGGLRRAPRQTGGSASSCCRSWPTSCSASEYRAIPEQVSRTLQALRASRRRRRRLWLFRRITQQFVEDTLDIVRVHGLGQVFIEPRGLGGLFVLLLAPTGERDEDGVASPGFEAHAARDFVAAHARHADVDDGGARPVALRRSPGPRRR